MYSMGTTNFPVQDIKRLLAYLQKPTVIEHHNTMFSKMVDGDANGNIFHAPWNIPNGWMSDFKIIPTPCLVFPNKDKYKLREKYGLPVDAKILGTGGFMFGHWKRWLDLTHTILKKLEDNEFLYLATSPWIEGDGGTVKAIRKLARKLGKQDQLKVEEEFVDDVTLNERFQCCDLLFVWNGTIERNWIFSTSGIGGDLYGARRRLVIQDVPHYKLIAGKKGVVVAPFELEPFVARLLEELRTGNLDETTEPEWLSWDNIVRNFIDYFKEILEE